MVQPAYLNDSEWPSRGKITTEEHLADLKDLHEDGLHSDGEHAWYHSACTILHYNTLCRSTATERLSVHPQAKLIWPADPEDDPETEGLAPMTRSRLADQNGT